MEQKYINIRYRERDHGTFDEEWPPYKKTSGWWYITGYLSDKQNTNHLYSYQYTVAQGLYLGKGFIFYIWLFRIWRMIHTYSSKKSDCGERRKFEQIMMKLYMHPINFI